MGLCAVIGRGSGPVPRPEVEQARLAAVGGTKGVGAGNVLGGALGEEVRVVDEDAVDVLLALVEEAALLRGRGREGNQGQWGHESGGGQKSKGGAPGRWRRPGTLVASALGAADRAIVRGVGALTWPRWHSHLAESLHLHLSVPGTGVLVVAARIKWREAVRRGCGTISRLLRTWGLVPGLAPKRRSGPLMRSHTVLGPFGTHRSDIGRDLTAGQWK